MPAAAVTAWLAVSELARPLPASPDRGYVCSYTHAPASAAFDATALAADLVAPGPLPRETPGEWRLLIQLRNGNRWIEAGVLVHPPSGAVEPALYWSTHDGVTAVGPSPAPGSTIALKLELDVSGVATVRLGDRPPIQAQVGFDRALGSVGLQLAPGLAARGEFRRARFQRQHTASWWPLALEARYADPGLGLETAAGHALRFTGSYQHGDVR